METGRYRVPKGLPELNGKSIENTQETRRRPKALKNILRGVAASIVSAGTLGLTVPSSVLAASDMTSCKITVYSNSKFDISVPNKSPFTLVAVALTRPDAKYPVQYGFSFNGKVMTTYADEKKKGETKKHGSAFGLTFSNIAILYVGYYPNESSHMQISKFYGTSLIGLLRNSAGRPEYRWPNPGAETKKACRIDAIPFMNGKNVSIGLVKIPGSD